MGGGGPWRGRGRGRGDYRQHQEHQHQREVVRSHPHARNGNVDGPAKSQSRPPVNGNQADQPVRTFEEASAEIQVLTPHLV